MAPVGVGADELHTLFVHARPALHGVAPRAGRHTQLAVPAVQDGLGGDVGDGADGELGSGTALPPKAIEKLNVSELKKGGAVPKLALLSRTIHWPPGFGNTDDKRVQLETRVPNTPTWPGFICGSMYAIHWAFDMKRQSKSGVCPAHSCDAEAIVARNESTPGGLI